MKPVHVGRFFLGCLTHASYMIASEGVAAVIDPQRDVDLYLETVEAPLLCRNCRTCRP